MRLLQTRPHQSSVVYNLPQPLARCVLGNSRLMSAIEATLALLCMVAAAGVAVFFHSVRRQRNPCGTPADDSSEVQPMLGTALDMIGGGGSREDAAAAR